MKLYDVVNQIRLVLPKYTDAFSQAFSVSDIVVSSGVATITTPAYHKLNTGDTVTLSNYVVKTPLAGVSQDGLVFTFTTESAHDLTEEWQETVELGNFTDTEWNTSFTLLSANNRKTFTVRSTNDLPTLNGNEYVLEDRIDGINGQHTVTVVNRTTFTITGEDFLDGTYDDGTVNCNNRIVGAVSLDRFLEHYTRQNVSDLYMCVVMGDANTSKNRTTLTDAIYDPTAGVSLTMTLIDNFSVYVVGSASNDIAAQSMVDTCRHDLLGPILHTLFGVSFSTGLSIDKGYKTVLLGHQGAFYDKAIYVHEYNFELSMEISDDDAVVEGDTRAFRDIYYSHDIGDEDSLTITVDLDDEPLTGGE